MAKYEFLDENDHRNFTYELTPEEEMELTEAYIEKLGTSFPVIPEERKH